MILFSQEEKMLKNKMSRDKKYHALIVNTFNGHEFVISKFANCETEALRLFRGELKDLHIKGQTNFIIKKIIVARE